MTYISNLFSALDSLKNMDVDVVEDQKTNIHSFFELDDETILTHDYFINSEGDDTEDEDDQEEEYFSCMITGLNETKVNYGETNFESLSSHFLRTDKKCKFCKVKSLKLI